MKKFFCLLICLLISVSGIVNASELNQTDEMSKKLEIVKERIPDTEEYDEFTANRREVNGDVAYSFEWTQSNADASKFLNISINSEDIITQYHFYSGKRSYDSKPSIKRLSSKNAAERAEELIFEINPLLKDRICVEVPKHESLYAGDYGFSIKRLENGIDVYGDTGYISINEDATEIIDFYINYTVGLKFHNSSNFISKDDAQNAYKDSLGLKLIYSIKYENNKKRTVSLKYVPSEDNNTYINAYDGSVFSRVDENKYQNETFSGSASNEKTMLDSVNSSNKFTPSEKAEIDKISNLLSVEEIQKIVYENKILDIDSSCKTTGSSVSRDYYDPERYYYFINFESSDGECRYSICCDAKDGQIINYNRFLNSMSGEAKLSETEALNRADVFARQLAKSYFTLDSNNTYIKNDNLSNGVSYNRVVNGIECAFGGINASVNKYDGKLNYFNISHDNLDFPEPDDIVSLEEATSSLFNAVNYKVIYIPSFVDGTVNAVCVYAFDSKSSIAIDAFNGKIESSVNDTEIIPYKDIDNHYAKEQIEELRRFGIGFSGGEFKPEDKITQGEYLTLLSAIFGGSGTPIILKDGYDYSATYKYATRNDIIDEKNINEGEILNRKTAAVMLVKAMGYDEVAKLEGIYITVFQDVNDKMGYITILNKMGVINGDGNKNFLPEKEITRAEAAMIIYNYLSR